MNCDPNQYKTNVEVNSANFFGVNQSSSNESKQKKECKPENKTVVTKPAEKAKIPEKPQSKIPKAAEADLFDLLEGDTNGTSNNNKRNSNNEVEAMFAPALCPTITNNEKEKKNNDIMSLYDNIVFDSITPPIKLNENPSSSNSGSSQGKEKDDSNDILKDISNFNEKGAPSLNDNKKVF